MYYIKEILMDKRSNSLHRFLCSVEPKAMQQLAQRGISVDQSTRSRYKRQAEKRDFWEWLDWDVEAEFKSRK